MKTEEEEIGTTICLDLDGVIHAYTSGWKGDSNIPDQPILHAKEAIQYLRENGWTVKVLSTRGRSPEGREAVYQWLDKHGIFVDEVCTTKPPAVFYVDDRAIRFNGSWEDCLAEIKERFNNGGKKLCGSCSCH